jgi:hypothetical protein
MDETASDIKQVLQEFVKELREIKEGPRGVEQLSDKENSLLSAVGLDERSFGKTIDNFVLEQEVRSINDKMDSIIALLQNGGA